MHGNGSTRRSETPLNQAWQLFNYGFGLYSDGIFNQFSRAIITKMSIWLIPNPGGTFVIRPCLAYRENHKRILRQTTKEIPRVSREQEYETAGSASEDRQMSF
jgi:hypothetical protein